MGPWPIEGAGGRTYWIIQQEIKWLEDGTRKPLYVIARQDEKIGWGDFDDARAAVEREKAEDKSMTAEEKQAWIKYQRIMRKTVKLRAELRTIAEKLLGDVKP